MNTQLVEGLQVGDISRMFLLDGTDEQEDELDDVAKGKLDAPTDDEGPGEIFESNKGDVALETEDEAGA